jgi:hypothetical protein
VADETPVGRAGALAFGPLVFGCHLLLQRSHCGRWWCSMVFGCGYGIGDAAVRITARRPVRTGRRTVR